MIKFPRKLNLFVSSCMCFEPSIGNSMSQFNCFHDEVANEIKVLNGPALFLPAVGSPLRPPDRCAIDGILAIRPNRRKPRIEILKAFGLSETLQKSLELGALIRLSLRFGNGARFRIEDTVIGIRDDNESPCGIGIPFPIVRTRAICEYMYSRFTR